MEVQKVLSCYPLQPACMQEFVEFVPILHHALQEFVEGEYFAGELYVDEAKASFQQLGFKR